MHYIVEWNAETDHADEKDIGAVMYADFAGVFQDGHYAVLNAPDPNTGVQRAIYGYLSLDYMPEEGRIELAAYRYCVLHGQDCIAARVSDSNGIVIYENLYGPRAEKWLPFNHDFFRIPAKGYRKNYV